MRFAGFVRKRGDRAYIRRLRNARFLDILAYGTNLRFVEIRHQAQINRMIRSKPNHGNYITERVMEKNKNAEVNTDYEPTYKELIRRQRQREYNAMPESLRRIAELSVRESHSTL